MGPAPRQDRGMWGAAGDPHWITVWAAKDLPGPLTPPRGPHTLQGLQGHCSHPHSPFPLPLLPTVSSQPAPAQSCPLTPPACSSLPAPTTEPPATTDWSHKLPGPGKESHTLLAPAQQPGWWRRLDPGLSGQAGAMVGPGSWAMRSRSHEGTGPFVRAAGARSTPPPAGSFLLPGLAP